MTPSRVYLDHASTSPLRPEARQAMLACLDQVGDPSRQHADGMAARHALEAARDQVATLFGARNREVCFTSGATEAIAAACWGAGARGAHQVVPAIEHSAVRFAAERQGKVTLVAPDRHGRMDADAVLAAIRDDTALVHLQWGNHEVGTLQPVSDVVSACRERGVLVHVDAAQAAGREPIDLRALGADLLSVSSHKLGGPAGAGALLIRRGLRLPPLLVGGDQERARRAGYENVPALVGFGAACAVLVERMTAEVDEQRRLSDRTVAGIANTDGLQLYGDPKHRLPHIVCLGVEGIEPQAVLLGLDRAGISAHSGSACSSEASLEPSPVLEAMGVDAHHSLRLSVGWSSADGHIDRLLDALPAVLGDLRRLASPH